MAEEKVKYQGIGAEVQDASKNAQHDRGWASRVIVNDLFGLYVNHLQDESCITRSVILL